MKFRQFIVEDSCRLNRCVEELVKEGWEIINIQNVGGSYYIYGFLDKDKKEEDAKD